MKYLVILALILFTTTVNAEEVKETKAEKLGKLFQAKKFYEKKLAEVESKIAALTGRKKPIKIKFILSDEVLEEIDELNEEIATIREERDARKEEVYAPLEPAKLAYKEYLVEYKEEEKKQLKTKNKAIRHAVTSKQTSKTKRRVTIAAQEYYDKKMKEFKKKRTKLKAGADKSTYYKLWMKETKPFGKKIAALEKQIRDLKKKHLGK